LEQITNADPPSKKGASSYLTRNLSKDEEYRCEGRSPWLGDDSGRGCDRPLRGSLRGATNVYFSVVKSALFLPRRAADVAPELIQILENPPLSALTGLLRNLGQPITPEILRTQQGPLLSAYSDPQIGAAIEMLGKPASEENVPRGSNDEPEVAFRRPEYAVLQSSRDDEEILTVPRGVDEYEPDVAWAFSRITLVPRVRETRAFAGFTRVFPENDMSLADRKAMLWRNVPSRSWLPAYKVFGEGMFLEVDEARLRVWESRPEVVDRIRPLAEHFSDVLQARRLRSREVSPRLVLLHTLAHLLMNQLTFDCGYSSASLRERLFVSADQDAPMSGVLVYTAAGDADGTMGGLVRMGKPGNLEPVIRRAVENARWCSADPVCMELGVMHGQGPDSCNLAACHNCALVPETSCEEFNRFLDRALVIGTLKNPEMGFFSPIGMVNGA
jgi:hypothetical protein